METKPSPCNKILDKGRCCCNCKNHYEDFHHCTTKKRASDEPCVCSEHKGWICLVLFEDDVKPRAYSGWSEHGMCELYVQKNDNSLCDDSNYAGYYCGNCGENIVSHKEYWCDDCKMLELNKKL